MALKTLHDVTKLKDRKEIIEDLEELYEKGYRYVVRDLYDKYLTCFSLKPKKYEELESWGYVNSDLLAAKMAYPLENTDVKEINWNNKNATSIRDFLKDTKELK